MPPRRSIFSISSASRRVPGGEHDEQFDVLAADAFAAMPWNFFRPGSLCHAGSAAAWLGDRALAEQLVPFLEPYADELLVAPVACLVFDAADSVRGMLLAVLDRLDEAITCFEAASAVCERAGDVPHSVMNAHRLAGAFVTRSGAGDNERARILAVDALEPANGLGQAPDVRFARVVLDAAT